MPLSYKNLSKDDLLYQSKNINLAEAGLVYNDNLLEISPELIIDVNQISHQADVFARELYTHRSKFDMKRFLGSYEDDWLRLLHETYVYDRCKCLYYGVNSTFISKFPDDVYSFPGNVLLFILLKNRTYKFTIKDDIPFTINFKLRGTGIFNILAEPIFKEYPELKNGISDIQNVYSYFNSEYEKILEGLYTGKVYLDGNKTNGGGSLFEIIKMNDIKMNSFFLDESFPFMNSFISKDNKKFYFILPNHNSKNLSMRFNESIYISRALGLRCDGLIYRDNQLYRKANKDDLSDFNIREEVFSITGLRTDIVPYSQSQIKEYLGINTFKKLNEVAVENSNLPLSSSN